MVSSRLVSSRLINCLVSLKRISEGGKLVPVGKMPFREDLSNSRNADAK